MCHYDVQCKICHLKSGIGYLQCFGFGIWYLVLGIGYLVLGIWHLHLICVSFCICICTCINFCILGTSPKGCFVQADFCRGETFLILHEGHNCTFVLSHSRCVGSLVVSQDVHAKNRPAFVQS